MMVTVKYDNFAAEAAGQTGPLNPRESARFVSLQTLACAEPAAAAEGATLLVLDREKFARKWLLWNLGRGFEEAVADAEMYLETLQARQQ